LRGSSRSLAGPARGSNRSRTPGSEDCVRLAIAPLSSFAQTAWIFLAIDSDCLSGNNKMISNGYERRRSFAGLFAAAIRGWPGRAGLCKSSTPRLLKRRGETLPSSPCFSRVIEECNELRGDGRFRCMRSHGACPALHPLSVHGREYAGEFLINSRYCGNVHWVCRVTRSLSV
jgi:hypothetical protein